MRIGLVLALELMASSHTRVDVGATAPEGKIHREHAFRRGTDGVLVGFLKRHEFDLAGSLDVFDNSLALVV
jgi:hypothetical protein